MIDEKKCRPYQLYVDKALCQVRRSCMKAIFSVQMYSHEENLGGMYKYKLRILDSRSDAAPFS